MAALPSVAKGRPAADSFEPAGDASLAAGGVARFPISIRTWLTNVGLWGIIPTYQDTIHTHTGTSKAQTVPPRVFVQTVPAWVIGSYSYHGTDYSIEKQMMIAAHWAGKYRLIR